MKIALVAHDRRKTSMIKLTAVCKHTLEKRELYAAGATDIKVMEATGLPVHCFKSGPLGGGQRIGAMISEDSIDLAIFLRDPLSAQPHEPGMTALIRLGDVCGIPLAINIGSAEILLRGVEVGFVDFREVIHEGDRWPLAFQRTLTVILTILWYILRGLLPK